MKFWKLTVVPLRLWEPDFLRALRTVTNRNRGYGWKPSSSSNLPIRVVQAVPLIDSRQTVLCRAIRGNSIRTFKVRGRTFCAHYEHMRARLRARLRSPTSCAPSCERDDWNMGARPYAHTTNRYETVSCRTPGLHHHKISVFSNPDPGKYFATTYEIGFLSNPDPCESLLSGNLVMETGCTYVAACGVTWRSRVMIHVWRRPFICIYIYIYVYIYIYIYVSFVLAPIELFVYLFVLAPIIHWVFVLAPIE